MRSNSIFLALPGIVLVLSAGCTLFPENDSSSDDMRFIQGGSFKMSVLKSRYINDGRTEELVTIKDFI